mmetsp:Transcript_24091/g.35511  ORF Transcript_24091/g.35511 Transcript_24091/m.35511 type:complete len:148 (-) Transcript_24091:1525-1968(-)
MTDFPNQAKKDGIFNVAKPIGSGVESDHVAIILKRKLTQWKQRARTNPIFRSNPLNWRTIGQSKLTSKVREILRDTRERGARLNQTIVDVAEKEISRKPNKCQDGFMRKEDEPSEATMTRSRASDRKAKGRGSPTSELLLKTAGASL